MGQFRTWVVMTVAGRLDRPRALRGLLKPIDWLIDALADPTRRERAVLAVLAAYAVIWTLYGVLAKASQDMQVDAAELVVWSHHPALGYAKHPPLAAWLVRAWFALFPVRDWSYYLFAIGYATVGLWLAWRLYGRLLAPEKRIVALACLTFVPYFNFHGLRFDHNAALGPLWAATVLIVMRSLETRSAGWAALAGAAAAAAVLGKYWSIFLLAGLGLAALLDPRRALYFRSPAPWITIAVGALVLAPHIVWLLRHDFIPLTYAFDAHVVKSVGDIATTVGRYLGGAAGYAAAPVLAVLASTRPSGAALADVLLPRIPERRFIAVTFWTTLLLPALCAPLLKFDLNPIWTMAILLLLPAILLSSPLLTLRRQAVVAITAIAVALPPAMLIASPIIAAMIHRAGPDPVSAHAELLAARVGQAWRDSTERPLRILGGEFGLANAAAFYLPGQPASYPVLEPETAPWVTPARIARDGAVMVCQLHGDEHACTPLLQQAIDKAIAGNPPPRHVEVTLTRSFWGVAGKPQRYLIAIILPR